MSILTTLTRMWLTRTTEPFLFEAKNDDVLFFSDCESLGLYIHIPFCAHICGFCPYCKELYEKDRCDRYIAALLREIHQVGGQQAGKKRVTSLYFGGGSPALAAEWLPAILRAVAEHFTITDGVGIELHPGQVTVPLLRALREAGVTRISIGVQSFQGKYQAVLGRAPVDAAALSKALAAVPFQTVSMDFIFALPGQTFADLRADVDTAFASGANHIALYPFIPFTFAENAIPPMPPKEKRALLDAITGYCLQRGCVRTSIWTFSAAPAARYSSMTRENFLGFGCSAVTLLRDSFKINTFSVEEYCACTGAGRLPTALTLRFTRRQRMVYWLFWEAYSTRVRAADFEVFFGVPLARMYGFELWVARRLGLIESADGVYTMTLRGAFWYHYYEGFYTLAYIDRMWSVLSKEAFPRELRL